MNELARVHIVCVKREVPGASCWWGGSVDVPVSVTGCDNDVCPLFSLSMQRENGTSIGLYRRCYL